MHLMRSEILPESQILVVSGKGSGRQFDQLNSVLMDPVSHLELFELVSHFDLGNTRIDAVDGVVHGSALLVRAFLKIAEMHGLSVMDYLHFVTSADAKAQLPAGSRYHQIQSPTPEGIRLAMQGDPSVRD